MRKEVLTDNNISQDIIAFKKRHPRKFLNIIEYLIAFLILSIIVIAVAFKFHWIAGTLSLALPVIVAIIFIPRIRAAHISENTVTCGEYTVIKDKLVNIAHETVVRKRRISPLYPNNNRYSVDEVEALYFSSRHWCIPRRCYEWSSLYNMSGDGISNTSVIGDEFYLIILNETQEICVAYNTKFFEYK